MAKKEHDQLGLDLTPKSVPWPPQSRFPHNFDDRQVGPQLREDLLGTTSPLIVTGYAGIESLLGLFESFHAKAGRGEPLDIRLLIGVEPTLRVPDDPSVFVTDLKRGIEDHWLERGISLLNARSLITTLELLREGAIAVRTSDSARVHAKIYVGNEAATLGSSNYTRPGLARNLEGNARFHCGDEPDRYREAVALAENLWRLGRDYTDDFERLLGHLLQNVTWQEALSRACAELLEGDWAPDHLFDGEERDRLWPSQERGIRQALWVLENQGAVLIADATGSGKTRMGAHLVRVLQDRNWRLGRPRLRFPMVVCPPAVKELWSSELIDAAEAPTVFSHGRLREDSARSGEVRKALQKTHVLTIDEAHNFLNRSSQRSRILSGNVADNVILLTATPINRGPEDLLAIVELLGADNFGEDVLDVLSRLSKTSRRQRSTPIQVAEKQQLRAALQGFVVRRTKDEFNRLIDREPERYVNALGMQCRYPEHTPVVFKRSDPAADRQRAFAIREKAKSLRGIVNFQNEVKMPSYLRFEGFTDERFLRMRLTGASALAAYQVRSRLRSSKIALVEHLLGTEEAERSFGLSGVKSSESGNVIATMQRLAGRPPKVSLDAELPDWLADPEAHRRATEEEIAVYRDILRQAEAMSEHRAEENVEYLVRLMEEHERVLAFDSHLISLYDLRRRLEDRGGVEIALATGEKSAQAKRGFAKTFALEAQGQRVIGLCSDALAEGLNLQGASALVHLDLPSVIRVLEQRIGRVDRMDSPHDRIAVHWPDEPDEFKLRADDKLLWRLGAVSDLLGSNVPIPAELGQVRSGRDEPIDIRELIEAVSGEDSIDTEMTLADAFDRVRGLVAGHDAIVPITVYEAVRTSQARVLSSVAVVPSRGDPWVFLAVGVSDRAVPHWVLIENGAKARVEGTLDRVAQELRFRLGDSTQDVDFDDRAANELASAIRIAQEHHIDLLSRRKRRALEEMQSVLGHYRRRAKKTGAEAERKKILEQILSLVGGEPRAATVDLNLLADWWLQLVRPEWYAHLTKKRVKRPARLKDLRKALRTGPISTQRLQTIREFRLRAEPLDRKVVAAIVGIRPRS